MVVVIACKKVKQTPTGTNKLSLPTVKTTKPSNITSNSASCGGNVTSNGNGTIIARGICWNISGNPTLDDNIGSTYNGSGTGFFSSQLTGLTENTTYYVAAHATNEYGTAYGQVESFVAKDPPCGQLTIDYQGQTYNTVLIGNQCWMKKNLNYPTGNSWCYDNDPANCETYGRLYDWETLMNGEASSNSVPSGVQGICPTGWHVPSDLEWDVLVDHLGGSDVAGGKMKETGTTHWSSPNTGATNESGFTALPGSCRINNGNFGNLGSGYWWSATENSSLYAWYRGLYYKDAEVSRGYSGKGYGFSVRCLRD